MEEDKVEGEESRGWVGLDFGGDFLYNTGWMDIDRYFESLGQEISALKGRVRYLIADAHWQTDGEWKESVLRQVLRRNLPTAAIVGRGFVVCGQAVTHQLDLLIHDASMPVLFRDGDLVFVTPDAVLGIIEVKSRLTPYKFEKTLRKLAHDINLVRLHPNIRAFAGIFAFDSNKSKPSSYLDATARVASEWNERLDFASIGDSMFIKYWNLDPETDKRRYDSWEAYQLPQRAYGYFIHNVIGAVSPESIFSNEEAFPRGGKGPFQVGVIKSAWAEKDQ